MAYLDVACWHVVSGELTSHLSPEFSPHSLQIVASNPTSSLTSTSGEWRHYAPAPLLHAFGRQSVIKSICSSHIELPAIKLGIAIKSHFMAFTALTGGNSDWVFYMRIAGGMNEWRNDWMAYYKAQLNKQERNTQPETEQAELISERGCWRAAERSHNELIFGW